MKIHVQYTTQLRMALDRAEEEVELAPPGSTARLLEKLSQRHGKPFDDLVFQTPGELNRSILVCVGDKHIGNDLSYVLQDGDQVTLLSVISGG
jgi:molybdopterin converting factor small subunit